MSKLTSANDGDIQKRLSKQVINLIPFTQTHITVTSNLQHQT